MLMTLPTVDELEKELAERKLSEFIKQAWPIIEPGADYLHNWHIDCICEYLQAVDAGQIARLLINMPPRYMKSITVSVMWPVWSWLKRPTLRWMFASYNQDLSTQHSIDRRTIIQSDWYQSRWGNRFRLTSDQNVKTEYRNDQQGRMFATSFNGGATGKGGNRLVIDDPHDPKRAESDLQRERAITTFSRKLSTRLNDKKHDPIVVVMQRLHEKDLSAHVLEQGYVHLCLPAEDTPGKVISTPTGAKHVRDESGLLWPEREGEEQIKLARAGLGPYGYAGQYQQRPAPLGGGRFKSKWFRYFRRVDDFYQLNNGEQSWAVKVEDCQRFAVVDPAGAEKEQDNRPCYTVIQVWDVAPSWDMMLVHQYRENVSVPDAADAIVRIFREFDCEKVAVEKDGIGLGVIQTARRKGVPVQAIKARGSKEARTETAEIRMAAGMVYFDAEAAYRSALESELSQFPNSEFADQVDAFAYAAMAVQKIGGPPRNTSGDEHLDDDVHEERQAEKLAEAADDRPGKQIAADPSGDVPLDDPEVREWLEGNNEQ